MDEMISRQAAIDAINHICPVDTEYDCTLLDRVDVRCVLSDLPSAQPEPRWIPVEERLPEVGKFVLVTDMYLDDVTIARFDGAWEDQHGNWSSFGCVTAWMPLPERYRGGEDGE